jgi:hypothetical protein
MKIKDLITRIETWEIVAIRIAGFISLLLFLCGYIIHEAKVI